MYLIIFDVDGTLVDSQVLIVEAQRRAFTALGLEPPSRERALSIVGLSLPEAFTVLAGPDGPVEQLAAGYRAAFAQLRADPAYHEPLFPGSVATLQALARRENVLLGIATGKSRRGVTHLLERWGWDDLFVTIQTADDAPSKPHPGMILRALAETGISPERAAMIGDSTFDMAMARAAGIAAIGVAWGYHRPEALIETGAATVVESYGEVLPALSRHLGLP